MPSHQTQQIKIITGHSMNAFTLWPKSALAISVCQANTAGTWPEQSTAQWHPFAETPAKHWKNCGNYKTDWPMILFQPCLKHNASMIGTGQFVHLAEEHGPQRTCPEDSGTIKGNKRSDFEHSVTTPEIRIYNMFCSNISKPMACSKVALQFSLLQTPRCPAQQGETQCTCWPCCQWYHSGKEQEEGLYLPVFQPDHLPQIVAFIPPLNMLA